MLDSHYLFYFLLILILSTVATAFQGGLPCDQCDDYCSDICDDGYAYGTCMILCGMHCY